MAEIRFPLEAFGLYGLRVQQYEFEPQEPTAVVLDRPASSRENPARSLLGGYLIENLRLHPGQYTDSSGQTRSFGGLTLDTVLMRASLQKHIVRTMIAGSRGGSRKEYIADGDYDIRIYGTLQREDNVYPQEEKDRLIQLVGAQAPIEITSSFLNDLGITRIIINTFTINQRPGYENQVLFELSAESDRDVELLADDEAP